VLLTKNGEVDLVVISIEAYQKMMIRQRLDQMLGKVEIKSGKRFA